MDVLEIDAASRTKVEQTRELLEVVSYAPVRDRYKVLIIDEAHMLSKASFNALLKTLEEPPPNVMFVLATTEMGKILPTILSRCQVFEFRRVAVRELADHLRRICDSEKIEISDASLERVARAGEGSVRDSLSVLERVLAFCGHAVDDDDVLRLLGGVRGEVLVEIIGSLARRDAGSMLGVLDGLVDEGHDLGQFWAELIGCVRDLQLIEAVPQRQDLLSRPPEEAAALQAAAEGLTREDLSRIFQLLADLEPALRSSSRPRFMFESALIRLAGLGAVRPIEDVLASLAGGSGIAPAPAARPAARKAAPPRPTTEKKSPDAPTAPETVAATGDLAVDLVARIRVAKPMIAAMLEQATSIRVEGRKLSLGFSAESVARPLQRKETLELIGKHAEKLVGQPLEVQIRIETVEAAGKGAATPSATAADKPNRGSSKRPERGHLLKEATGEPGVKKLLREFGAQVVDIRPLAKPAIPGASKGDPVEDS